MCSAGYSLPHCQERLPVGIFAVEVCGARRRRTEAPVAAERTFTCGNSRYYVVACNGHFIVQRQDWLGRSFVTYARDLAEAIARIEADAQCWQIKAA